MGEGASGYKRALGRWGLPGGVGRAQQQMLRLLRWEDVAWVLPAGSGARAFIGFAIWYATVRAVAYWQ
jgi:hypothetical protein